jgi:hypothetical protein
VLILFSIVNTKIVHYSSLCYFPLTYLAALRLERIWRGERKLRCWLRASSLGAILGSLMARRLDRGCPSSACASTF